MTQVDYVGDAGSIQINCKQYSLQQCHWHSPAEHLINGKRSLSLSLSLKLNVSPPTNLIYNDFLIRYDLELHMVHVDTSNKISVVHAQFYQIGEPDSFLSKVMKPRINPILVLHTI